MLNFDTCPRFPSQRARNADLQTIRIKSGNDDAHYVFPFTLMIYWGLYGICIGPLYETGPLGSLNSIESNSFIYIESSPFAYFIHKPLHVSWDSVTKTCKSQWLHLSRYDPTNKTQVFSGAIPVTLIYNRSYWHNINYIDSTAKISWESKQIDFDNKPYRVLIYDNSDASMFWEGEIDLAEMAYFVMVNSE